MPYASPWQILAAQTGGPGPGGQQLTQMLAMFALIGLAFWFIILRPQKRDQEKRKSALDSLKKGDKVVTIGGIHGWVAELDKAGKTVSIRIDTKTTVKLDRSAVSRIETRDGAEGDEAAG